MGINKYCKKNETKENIMEKEKKSNENSVTYKEKNE